jgi:hypothetical protein
MRNVRGLQFAAKSRAGPGADVAGRAVEFPLTSLVTIEVSVQRTAIVWSLTIYREGKIGPSWLAF